MNVKNMVAPERADTTIAFPVEYASVKLWKGTPTQVAKIDAFEEEL